MRSNPGIFFRYVALVFLFLALSALASEAFVIEIAFTAILIAMALYLLMACDKNFPPHLVYILIPPLCATLLYMSRRMYSIPDSLPIAYVFIFMIILLGLIFTMAESKRSMD